MSNQLDSSDIKALLRIITTHQKGMGGGSPTSGQSAQLSKPTAPNAFMQWLQQAGNTVGNAIGVNKEFDPNALTEATGPNPGDVLLNDLAKGDFKGFGQHATELFGVSPKNFKEDPLNAILSVGMLATGAEGMKKGEIKPEEIGAKTAEQIKAEKAAGIAPKINSAQNAAVESSGILDAKGNPIPSTKSQYAVPETKAPLYSQAEKIASGQTTTKTPYTPNPDIPENPIPVTDRVGKHPVTGGNPVQVDLSSEAKRNSYYLSDQQKSQAVLDKYVPGNNAQEVEQALPLQLKEESQRIQNIIGQNPKDVSTSDIIKDNASNMAKKGFTPGNNVKADEATIGLQKELYSQLTAGKSNIVPPNMTGEDLRQQISIMDGRLQSVYKKMDNNTTLTPADTAALTYRQTLSNRLKVMYPSVGEALDRQTAMINAIPSVAKAAQAERTAAYTKATTPQSENLGTSLIKNFVGSPVKLAETLGLGAAAGVGIHGYLNPQTYNTSAGKVSLPTVDNITLASGNSLYKDSNDYVNGINAINDREKAIAFNVNLGIPSAVAEQKQLESQRNTLETNYAPAKAIMDQYDRTANIVKLTTNAEESLKKVDAKAWTAIGGIAGVTSKLGFNLGFLIPGYTKFQQDISNLENYGVNTSAILSAPNPKEAGINLTEQMKSSIDQLDTTLKNKGATIGKQTTGKDILNASVNAVHKSLTGNSMLDSIITPTPTQAPEPIPDDFQKLLQYKFQ